MPYLPPSLSYKEVVWLRQTANARVGVRGVYMALTETLNLERALAGLPPVSRSAVYSAAVGVTWKDLEVEPAPINHHLRAGKLTRDKVRQIVRMLDQRNPKLTTKEIARQFKVSQVAITKINLGQNHRWATRGQAISRRIRHKQTVLSKEDNLCMIRCAADREWWTYALLAEIFGMTSGMAVMHRVRAARKRHARKAMR